MEDLFFRARGGFLAQRAAAEVTRAEADYLQDQLRLTAGSRVLDVPSGHGRLAIELAARGCRVTGIDISPELLDAARRSARQRGVSVTWREGDMRELPWESDFDAAFSAGSSYTIRRGAESETKLASHRVYTVSQQLAMLQDAGLRPVSMHGSAAGEPYRVGSRQLFVVCQRE